MGVLFFFRCFNTCLPGEGEKTSIYINKSKREKIVSSPLASNHGMSQEPIHIHTEQSDDISPLGYREIANLVVYLVDYFTPRAVSNKALEVIRILDALLEHTFQIERASIPPLLHEEPPL